MALVHHWPLNEGAGTTINDIVGGVNLTPIVGHTVRWCQDRILGTENKDFLGIHIDGAGVGTVACDGCIRSAGTVNVGTPTISLLFRQIADLDGVMVRFESGSYIQTYSREIRVNNTNMLLDADDYDKSRWYHLVLVDDGLGNTDVYLNGAFVRTIVFNLNAAGNVRMFSFTDTLFPGGAELSDVRLYNSALTPGEIAALYATYGAPEANWSVFNDGSDFGGLMEYGENPGGVERSYMEIENDVTKFNFDGTVCIGGRSCLIPKRLWNGEIWAYFELNIPSIFDGNHGFAQWWSFFVIGRNTSIKQAGFEHIWSFGEHLLPSQDVEQEKTRTYWSGGTQEQAMVAFTLPKDTWIPCEIHIDYATGSVDVWINEVQVNNIAGNTLDYNMMQIIIGLYQGVHPQNLGNYYYMRNLFVGETRYVPPVPPTPTPTPPTPPSSGFKYINRSKRRKRNVIYPKT